MSATVVTVAFSVVALGAVAFAVWQLVVTVRHNKRTRIAGSQVARCRAEMQELTARRLALLAGDGRQPRLRCASQEAVEPTAPVSDRPENGTR